IYHNKSQSKSSGKFVQLEEPEFEIADSDMPQDQEGNLGNDDDEPMKETTPQQGQTQNWLMTLASSADKPSNTFDELMSTPIDFSPYIINGLKISNLTQKTLLGPAFKLLKGTRTNYAELEYDFEECYKALSEKLDWNNPEGRDYPFDLTKPLPLVMSALKTWFQIYGVLLKLPMINMRYGESHIRENNVEVIRKHRYGYLKEIVVRRADNDLYTFKEGDFPRLRINDIEDMLLRVNIQIEYLPQRRWSTLEKKRANIMIKAIDKQLKERRMMRSLKKFVGGRHYETDLRLL
ncbi:hypothetical protein Tco_0871846, partial [Tanacetum coccineum]